MNMKIIISFILVFLNFASIGSLQAANVIDKFNKKKRPWHNQIELLFFQHAALGYLKPGVKNCYTFILKGLKNDVIYFSNSPARETGYLRIEQFLATWKHGYEVNKEIPNAIVHANQHGTLVNYLVTLNYPRYNANEKSLSYEACPLKSTKSHFNHVIQLTDVNIFIDPFHPWPP